MVRSQKLLLAVNAVGGVLVLGSYACGLAAHPGMGGALWGGVPQSIRPVYAVSMLLAAAGYFPVLCHLVARVDPEHLKLPWGMPFQLFHLLFLAMLVPSALWMSLTFAWLAAPSLLLWTAIRAVLLSVGLSSLLMTILLAGLRRSCPDQFSWAAAIGSAVFTFHTLVLDALVWPWLFRQ